MVVCRWLTYCLVDGWLSRFEISNKGWTTVHRWVLCNNILSMLNLISHWVLKYVTSALTPDRQRVIDNQKNEVEAQESDDSEDRSTDDVEAADLMRTLCAHLLPYGVDRQATLEDVIPGWDEGIALFKEGGKGTLLIPSIMAYGPRDMGSIPANSILLFDIEVVKVG